MPVSEFSIRIYNRDTLFLRYNMNKENTMPNNPSVESILKAASEQPWLTTEQEIELGNRIKSGDEDALKQLINGKIRFVVSLAMHYQDRGRSLDELIETGYKGLELAAKKFDPHRGFKFIAYAVWYIRASILAVVSITDGNKNPFNLTDEEKRELVDGLTNEREKAIITRWIGLDCNPESHEEIDKCKNLTAEQVRQIREKAIRKISFEQSS